MNYPPWLIEMYKLAQKGDADLQFQVGNVLYEGIANVTKDTHFAVMWLHKAAVQGHAEAQYKLGKCFAEGNGGYPGQTLREDFVEAINWYRKAAQQGHTLALLHLGECYAKGEGVEADKVEAFAYLKLACKKSEMARGNFNAVRKSMLGSEIKSGQIRAKELSEGFE